MAPPYTATTSLDEALLYNSVNLNALIDSNEPSGDILAKKVYEAIKTDDFPMGYNFFFNRYAEFFYVGFRKGLYVKKKDISLIIKDISTLKFKSNSWPSPEDYAKETKRNPSTIHDLIKKGYLRTELVYSLTDNHKLRWSHRFEPSHYAKLIEEYNERKQFLEKNIGDKELAELTGFSHNQIEYFLRMGFIKGIKYYTSETQREGGRGTKICFSPEEVARIDSIINGLDYENLIQFFHGNELEINHERLIQTIHELGLENQYLPVNKRESNYKFSKNLAEAIVLHYCKLENKIETPKNQLPNGANFGVFDPMRNKRKIKEIRKRRSKSRKNGNCNSRDLILEEILSTPLLTREEEILLGKKIAVLEKKILSYLYSSHRNIVNEYYENLEKHLGSGQQEKNAAGKEYRAIIRYTHEELVSDVSKKNTLDLFWNLYSQKRDASYIKELLKLVDSFDEIDGAVTEWNNCLNDLIMGNTKTSFSASKKYSKKDEFLKWDDNFQESFFGQIRASEIWDYTTGNAFNIVSRSWVKAKITRNISNCGYTIRIPVYLREKLLNIKKHTNISNEEAIKKIGFNDHEIGGIKLAQEVQYEVKSLNTKVRIDEDPELIDFVADETELNPESLTEDYLRQQSLLTALQTLPEREEKVIRMRFGVLEEKDHTLEEIGQMMGITRERVRQIEANGFKRLRKKPEIMELLKEFL